ncbi:MAG: hypothetical protein H7Z38_24195 [Rubrivivax sp.]|nr:hypothetical protein [Pyrinomonadaceae bacterium]
MPETSPVLFAEVAEERHRGSHQGEAGCLVLKERPDTLSAFAVFDARDIRTDELSSP